MKFIIFSKAPFPPVLLLSFLALFLLIFSSCTPINQDGVAVDDQYSFRRQEAAKINAKLAIHYLNSGNLSIAKEKVDKALLEAPNLALVHDVAGLVSVALNKYDNAERYFNKALDLEPNNGNSLNNYAIFLLFNRENPNKALKLLKKALNDPFYKTKEIIYTNIAAALLISAQQSPKTLNNKDYELIADYVSDALFANQNYLSARIKLIEAQIFFRKFALARQSVLALHKTITPTSYSMYLGLKIAVLSNNKVEQDNYQRTLLSQFPKSAETRNYLRYLKGREKLK